MEYTSCNTANVIIEYTTSNETLDDVLVKTVLNGVIAQSLEAKSESEYKSVIDYATEILKKIFTK